MLQSFINVSQILYELRFSFLENTDFKILLLAEISTTLSTFFTVSLEKHGVIIFQKYVLKRNKKYIFLKT